MLICTTVLKRATLRLRPVVPPESRRMIDFRSKETNGSMPSGDTAQAALFAFFIKYNFPALFDHLGGDYFIIKFCLLVSFARVFHHCHFFGDTIVGSFLGGVVAALFHYSRLRVPLPTLLATRSL